MDDTASTHTSSSEMERGDLVGSMALISNNNSNHDDDDNVDDNNEEGSLLHSDRRRSSGGSSIMSKSDITSFQRFPSSRQSIRVSQALEDFLYTSLSPDDDGGGGSSSRTSNIDWDDRSPPSLHPTQHRISNGTGSIFETSFDLTEERLQRLFDLFDKDQDGNISYEQMKNGLKYHGLANLSDDATFNQLMLYLDRDKSGDISFEEFSEGIRA
ncbi:MAG: hypothetical protein SGARI_007502 [Bacillariaceae sp.]